ncbi:MAG: hypothetical protein JW797_08480 [Bradymonadales bacterium]|nr:hypothetical protein [Bradymonadales bacterium]
MTEPIIELLPPGPFPPHGQEPPATLDLAVRLRDQLFTSGFVAGLARNALIGGLKSATACRDRERMATLVQALVDTWPAAALVDEARERWTAGPDAASLAVLARVSWIAQLSLGWNALPEGIWPMPSASWVVHQVGARPVRLVSRGPMDGADTIGEYLSIPVETAHSKSQTRLAVLSGEELATRRAELASRLVEGEIAAVWFTSEVPADAASQLALAEIRLESDYQLGVERYGQAALELAGPIPSWEQLLCAPPPGEPGEVLVAQCNGLILPGTPAGLMEGETDPAGWLLWPLPCFPLAVHPVAVSILNQLDGQRNGRELAEAMDAPLEAVQEILQQLVQVGAATAA